MRDNTLIHNYFNLRKHLCEKCEKITLHKRIEPRRPFDESLECLACGTILDLYVIKKEISIQSIQGGPDPIITGEKYTKYEVNK